MRSGFHFGNEYFRNIIDLQRDLPSIFVYRFVTMILRRMEVIYKCYKLINIVEGMY